MAVILVTYDLKSPGQDYEPVYDYLQQFTYCKHMESVWLLDTTTATGTIRDDLKALADSNDVFFVTRLAREWSSWNYGCADWLNEAGRDW